MDSTKIGRAETEWKDVDWIRIRIRRSGGLLWIR